MAISFPTSDYALRAKSRKLGAAVLKPPSQEYRKLVDSPGSCSAVWICDRAETVLKCPLAFYLDGCDDEQSRKYRREEQESANLVAREKTIYKHLGRHNGILQCLQILDIGIMFPYMRNGDLRTFLRNEGANKPLDARLNWIEIALNSFDFIHQKGVIQGDVSARNFLVTDDQSIVLCDFSGSMIGDEGNLVRPETRYEKVGEVPMRISVETDIFAIGSLIYEIITGLPPYFQLKDEVVEQLFKRGEFPLTKDIYFGGIIESCWIGNFRNVAEILNATRKIP